MWRCLIKATHCTVLLFLLRSLFHLPNLFAAHHSGIWHKNLSAGDYFAISPFLSFSFPPTEPQSKSLPSALILLFLGSSPQCFRCTNKPQTQWTQLQRFCIALSHQWLLSWRGKGLLLCRDDLKEFRYVWLFFFIFNRTLALALDHQKSHFYLFLNNYVF